MLVKIISCPKNINLIGTLSVNNMTAYYCLDGLVIVGGNDNHIVELAKMEIIVEKIPEQEQVGQ